MLKVNKILFVISLLLTITTIPTIIQLDEDRRLHTVQSISISAPTQTLEVGYYTELYTTILPETARISSEQITWTSSNSNVATVSYGRVTAKNPGTATITATTPNRKKASCVFTVTAKVKSISLNYTSQSIAKGDSFTLVPTITPSNATNKSITWRSSNTNIATVSTSGVVTGISGGTATITATTNNNLYASCSVTVSNNATTYAISYTLNGGTNSSSNPASYTKLDTITLSQPTKTGYTFKGWTGSNGSTPQTYVSIPKGSSGSKNYTANWTANSYNISYVLNEGNFGSYHPTILTYDTSSTISNPTKAYASFTGWTITGMDSVTHTYGNSTTTNSSISSTKETNYKNLRSTSGTVTFTANWSYTNYSISYNLGGGTNNSSNPSTYTYYDSITLGVPTKNGYNFIGWTGSNGTTPQKNISISKYSTGNKSYIANWELADYTITYNLNGGSVSGTNAISYTITSNSITLINPTRTGYTFAGWTGSNGSTKQTNVTIASGSYGNKSYTANWTPIQYSISYNLNGGNNNSNNYTYYTIETARTIYSPTRNGYTFVGWTGSNGTTPQTSVAIAKGSTENKSYTANWEVIIYDITYNLNNGTVNGLNPTTYTVEDEDIIFINPTKDYYEFNYWGNSYCFNSNNKEYGIKKGSYGNKNITAYWTPINYTITYELDGGTVSNNKTSYNIETSTFTLNNPTKVGFEFIGWSGTSLTGNNNTNVQIGKGEHGNRQYTANWKANQFTLSFVTNCDSQVDDITQDCGSSLTLPKPVWNGKSLEGWYRDESLTTRFDEQTMPAEDLTLYAKWISYDITISPNEFTAISIIAQLTPTGIGATAVDTDGDSLELTLTTNGTFAVGETILIRLSTTGKYSTAKQKTYNEVKVYGLPEVSYNTTKDYINITDELVPELFSAVGTDTFGGNTTNILYVKEENYSAGDKVTIVIKYIDVAGNERIVEIPNVKVYGEPTITCVTEKIKAIDNNAYISSDINAKAYDSFGKEIPVGVENVTEIDTGFVNGDTYSYYTSSTQNIKSFTAYNTEKYTLYYKNSSSTYSYRTNVILYCETTKTTLYSSYSSNTSYSSYSFNVTAGYEYSIKTQRYSYSATFSMYLKSASKLIDYSSLDFVGKIITLKLTATDEFGNSYTKNVDLKVCGTPTISEPTKTLFKDTETISYETLGIISKDSFNDEITNVSIQLISGELVAGSRLQYLVTATDIVGNQAQKTISSIKIYGKPVIIYNTDKIGIKTTDNITASLFNAIAKDSFNTSLSVQTEIYSGNGEAGTYVKIKFTATDCVGNITEVITDDIGVYAVNDITLTYNQYLSDYIKLTSKGEEFNAVAKDSFNNNIELKVVATTVTLAGGNVISLKLVATDKAGNTKESDVINNIKVYDIPSISCNLERVYLYETADNIELYIVAVDSFNDEIVPTITIKSGEKVAASEITYLVTATDKAGNSKQCEYSFVVIGDNQAYVTFDVDGGSAIDIDFCGITINQNYQLPISIKTDYVFMGWYDNNGVQYTDRAGNSIKQFTNKGAFTLIAHWQLKHLINYELNGGSFDGNYPTSYTEVDVITLVAPTKTGYTFTGWTGSNGSTPQTSVIIAKGSTGNKSYTANWVIIEYNISYTLNGGTVDGTNPNKYTIQSGDITLLNPTRTGYTFAGWTGSNGNTAQMEVIIYSGSIGNKNYVANWTPIEYTIAYELNGGTINGTNPTTYNIESNDIALINPTKDYYDFVGWTGSNGSTPQTSIVIQCGSYGNKTYTANYTPTNYTINYDLAGSLVETSNPTSYNVETETFKLFAPTKTGYNFIGWTGFNGTTPQTSVTITKGSFGDKTYTANWEVIEYTITYILNDGIIDGNNSTKYTIESSDITLINPIKTGYTFVGWTGSNGITPQTSVTITRGSFGDKTYTVNWEVIEYTIAYELNGGTINGTNPSKYTIQSDDITLINPTRTGYTFTGWTGSNGTTPQTSITITKGSTGDKSYAANWKNAVYPIILDKQSGTGGTSTIYEKYNVGYYTDSSCTTQITNSANRITIPTRSGYTFGGYYTSSNGSGIQYISPSGYLSYSASSSRFTSLGRLYAKWTMINYSISYNLAGGSVATNNPTSYNIETETFSLVAPTKTGYTFTGWTGSNGTTPQTDVTITKGSTGYKTYNAHWEPLNYNVTYYLDGGINPNNVVKFTTNELPIKLEIPYKNDCYFLGWYNENTFTNFVTHITEPKDYNLYARFAAATNGLIYEDNMVTGYNGTEKEIIIAEYYNDTIITVIKEYAFENVYCTTIKIPDTIINIGDYAFESCNVRNVYLSKNITEINEGTFYNCTYLSYIQINNGVMKIGESAFSNCTDLLSINIPNSVTEISDYAFSSCTRLTSITIPNSVKTIGTRAFWFCKKLGYISIGSGVEYMGNEAFSYYENVYQIAVNSANAKYDSRNNCNAIIDTTNNELILGCKNTIIPTTITSIKSNAFYGCISLTNITIPSNIISIGSTAFNGCTGLTSIIIPYSVKTIGNGAFAGCTNLEIYCENTIKPTDWNSNWNSSNRPVYWYSETQPTTSGNYWHYVDGKVIIWE